MASLLLLFISLTTLLLLKESNFGHTSIRVQDYLQPNMESAFLLFVVTTCWQNKGVLRPEEVIRLKRHRVIHHINLVVDVTGIVVLASVYWGVVALFSKHFILVDFLTFTFVYIINGISIALIFDLLLYLFKYHGPLPFIICTAMVLIATFTPAFHQGYLIKLNYLIAVDWTKANFGIKLLSSALIIFVMNAAASMQIDSMDIR
ncbi:hypothetical protein FEI14_05525 [Lacticaseibacillus zeae]|nr:hypothetical protein FEI14_05525 [Lacticaseibacillus zeae]